ncbi:MAG: protein DA1 [Candidatus Wallbacteria bacterium]|nr:protein DA1 [Candidatus Wallbacteria bacterium]
MSNLRFCKFCCFFLLAILQCSSLWAESPECFICGTVIQGEYYTFEKDGDRENLKVCQNCYQNCLRCELCKIPLKKAVGFDGHNYCDSCYQKLQERPSCTLCGALLPGQYMDFTDPATEKHSYYCPECVKNFKKCQACGRPSRNLSQTGLYLLCDRCLETVKYCHSCGLPLIKESYKYEIFDYSYCRECEQSSRCSVCGLPAGKSGTLLSDGRAICPDCSKTQVTDIQEVRRVYALVSGFLSKTYSMNIAELNRLEFASLSDLKTMASVLNYIKKDAVPLGIFSEAGGKTDIFVQSSLPRKLLAGVLAHEYTHDFIHTVNPGFSDIEIEEGICEWVRWQVLRQIGDEKGCILMEHQEGVYSSGFSKVRAAAEKGGYSSVFDLFRK